MKICILGAGAIGGHVAVRLAAAGKAEVSVIARGEHLRTIQRDGLTLRNNEGESWQARFAQATDDAFALPPQDVVLVALKASSLSDQAEALQHLLSDDGVAVFLNNGIPWWWNHGMQGGSHGTLDLLDPDARLWSLVRPERTLGAVIYSPNEVQSPGVVFHGNTQSNRYILGEPTDTLTPRLQAIVDLMQDAGLGAETTRDVRREIWTKLLINVASNPLSALTRLDTAQLAEDPDMRQLRRALVTEVTDIAEAMGWTLPSPTAARPGSGSGEGKPPAARPAPGIRPSMLQDVLLGRAMEVDALLGQPQRFAREYGLATPTLDVVLTLLRGLDRSRTGSAA
jgi:2-dehydropantoate 2-reductase